MSGKMPEVNGGLQPGKPSVSQELSIAMLDYILVT